MKRWIFRLKKAVRGAWDPLADEAELHIDTLLGRMMEKKEGTGAARRLGATTARRSGWHGAREGLCDKGTVLHK